MNKATKDLLAPLVVLCAINFAPSASPALAAQVPGDYPTIQAALDAGEIEIVVSQGTYPESIQVRHDLDLRAEGVTGWSDSLARPVVGGMHVWNRRAPDGTSYMSYAAVRGIHFTGPVIHDGSMINGFTTSLETCQLDCGFTACGDALSQNIHITDCHIVGTVSIYAYNPRICDNVVSAGCITMLANGSSVITGNTITGPAPIGIASLSWEGSSQVRRNTIRGVQDGIVIRLGSADSNLVEDCSGTAYKSPYHGNFFYNVARRCGGHGIEGYGYVVGNSVLSAGGDGIHSSGIATGNVVKDCWGTGMVVSGDAYWPGVSENTIRRCGGHGMDVTFSRTAWLSGNVVDSVGGTGIYAHGPVWAPSGTVTLEKNAVRHAGGAGIAVESAGSGKGSTVVSGNRVSGSTTDGIVLAIDNLRVLGNIVGRSGGRGLVTTGERVTMRGNTVYLNEAAGIEVSGASSTAVDSIDHNIACQNGIGLRWLGSGTGLLACNDWYANSTANTEDILPGASDWSVDPLFCSIAEDNVFLSGDSPLLALEGCGLIGALGQGCVAVPMHFSLAPNVLNLRSNGRWVAGCLQPPVGYTAEDIDVRSIRLNGTVPVDSLGPVSVGDRDGDGVSDLEVKFDRSALALTVDVGAAVEGTVQGMVAGRSFRGTTTIRVQGAPRSATSEHGELPVAVLATSLQDVSPNPVRGAPVVHLTLADSRPATLALYDVSGRLVSSREIGSLGAGSHQVTLGQGLPPGVYLVRLRREDAMWIRRVVVLE